MDNLKRKNVVLLKVIVTFLSLVLVAGVFNLFAINNNKTSNSLLADSVAEQSVSEAEFPSSWKNELKSTTYMTSGTTIDCTTITSIKFVTTAPSGYLKIGTLSTGIEVYVSNTTNIAFVLAGTIYSPQSSEMLFSDLAKVVTIEFGNFNTSNCTDISKMFYNCKALDSLNVSGFNTSNVIDMHAMFGNCTSLTALDLSSFNTSNATLTYSMFANCSSLTSLNVSDFNTSKVTDMSDMFNGCSELTTLDVSNFDTSNVKNMSLMFCNCESLTTLNLSSFDTTKVEDINNIFDGCNNLTYLDLSNFNTRNVADFSCLFNGCAKLVGTFGLNGTAIKIGTNFKTTNANFMSQMFNECSGLTSIDVSGFDTSNVTDMEEMFHGCVSLLSMDLSNFDTSKVVYFTSLFESCDKITSINLTGLDTSSAMYMSNMFDGCYELESLDLSSFDLSKVVEYDYVFSNCTSLKTIKLPKTNPLSLELPDSGTWYDGNTKITTTPTTAGESKTPSVGFVVTAYANGGTLTETEGWTISEDNLSATKIVVYTEENLETLQTTLPQVTKEGYSLKGWYTQATDGNQVSIPLTVISDNTQVYAQWETADKLFPTTWKDELQNTTYMTSGTTVDYKTITSIKFETTASGGYSSIGTLSTGIEVYASGTTDIAFVLAGTIYAPEDSSNLFANLSALTQISFDNFNTTNVTDMSSMFYYCSKLTVLDVSRFDTSKVTDMRNMFQNCKGLTTLDVSKFDTTNVTNLSFMFFYCSKVTTLDVSKFDTSKVTDMRSMFQNCNSLRTLDVSKFDTSNVTDMGAMFQYCQLLTTLDVSKFDTSKVTKMSSMFYACSSLISLDVSGFYTSNVISMGNMFYGCSSLTSLDVSKFDTTNVTDMSYMFYACSSLTSLDVSGFYTSNVTSMWNMFCGCSKVTTLDVSKFDTSKVTDMRNMFQNCKALTTLDVSKFNTSKVKFISNMFYGCSGLEYLNLSSFDMSNVTKSTDFFVDCSSLKIIKTPQNIADTITIELPTNANWYSDDNILVENMPDYPTTVSIGYLVTANANGGEFTTTDGWTISEDNLCATKAVRYALNNNVVEFEQLTTLPQIAKEHYDLNGWFTQAIDGNKISTPLIVDGDLELYAQWTVSNDAEFLATWKTEVEAMGITIADITSIKFETVAPSEYTKVGDLSTGIEVYANGTNIAYVWPKNILAPQDSSSLFSDLTSVTEITFNNFVTTNISNMKRMFYGCNSLVTLNLSEFNTSNVTDISYMFSNCKALETLDLSNLNTNGVTTMQNMFSNCSTLTTLSFGNNFKTQDVTTMKGMFNGCSALTMLDLSNFDTTNVQYMDNMFNGCSSLEYLDLSSFDMSNVTSATKFLTGCSSLKIIKTPQYKTLSIALPTNGNWYSDDNTLYDEMPYYPTTIAIGYLVTANANGGTITTAEGWTISEDKSGANKAVRYVLNNNVVEFEQLSILPQAIKEGYALNGWFTLQEGGNEILAPLTVNSDTTIYAQFEANKFTYTFYDEDGIKVLKTDTIAYGETIVAPEKTPAKASDNTYTYSFAGWDPEFVEGTTITANVSYRATFTSNYINYTITFKNADGSIISIKTDYHYGDTIVEPTETPTKPADDENTYVFIGWTPEFVSTVKGNAEYVATFSSTTKSYTYTFFAEDGTTVLKTDTINYGETIVAPAENPTKASDNTYTYTFAGWDPEFVAGTTITANVSYRATFTSNYINYTITFKNADGSVISSKNDYHYGDTVETPTNTPTKPADAQYTYTFAGWTPELSTTVAGNVEYTATFTSTLNIYTYTFYDEDGTTVIKTLTINYGETIVAPQNPAKASDNTYTYTFAGWDPNFVEGTTITANVSYRATFTSNYINYTITFKNEDGSVILTKADYHYGDTVEVPANPTKPADAQYTYIFAGWTPELSTTVAGNVEYTATFTTIVNKYTITLKVSSGKFKATEGWTISEDGKTATKVVDYGTTVLEDIPEIEIEKGQNFIGWYTKQEGGEKVTLSEAIINNLTVYAHFEQVAQNGTSTLVIVLIVIGSLVVIAIITGAVIFGIRKSKSKKRKVVLNNPNLLNTENERNEVFNKNIKKPVMQEQTQQKVNTNAKKIEKPKFDSNKDAK